MNNSKLRNHSISVAMNLSRLLWVKIIEILKKYIKKFDDELSYSLVEFDGQQLIFSIAHGYAKYEEGLKYKDILQKADKAMYTNKKMLKEKYGMASR